MARYTVQRIRLNAGGYDRGVYFGVGAPLYWIASPDGRDDIYVRASDHKAALAKAKALWPLETADGTWPRSREADLKHGRGEL